MEVENRIVEMVFAVSSALHLYNIFEVDLYLTRGPQSVKDNKILVDTDQKGFTFNGISTGLETPRPDARKSKFDELSTATKDVEDATKDVLNPKKSNGKPKDSDS